jgi:histone H3/H4
MHGIEVSIRFYLKGENALIRLANLKKLAREVSRGNISKMVNEALNKYYELDPETGERLSVKR